MTIPQPEYTSLNRREFIQSASSLVAVGLTDFAPSLTHSLPEKKPLATIRIKNIDSNFEREPLNPYRFKGSAITESW